MNAERGSTEAGERPEVRRLLALHVAAHRLAVVILGSPEGAEDVVQQAYLEILAQVRAGRLPREERSWFLRIVANRARNWRKLEARRRRREAVVGDELVPRMAGAPAGGAGESPGGVPLDSPQGRELVERLRLELAGLDEKYRVPVTLCCEQGLSHREAAEVLEVPRQTLSERVAEGLELLRRGLSGAGFAVAPAAMLGALAQAAPPVPAALTVAVTRLLVEGLGAPVAGAGAASTGIKGGLIMKAGLGIAALGLIAGGVLWAAGGSSGEPAKPAEKPGKFATPVTDAGTRWVREGTPYLGSGLTSDCLDGPRLEMRTRAGPSRGLWFESGSDFVLRAYNPANERYYTVGGRALGPMDGPLSRARFGGVGYMKSHACAGSSDGRFFYFTEPDQGGVLRVIDFEKQTVATLSKDLQFSGMTADAKGNLWGLKGRGDSVAIVSPEGKVVEEKKLDLASAGKIGDLFMSFQNIALDEVHNRLYGSNRATGDWTIWYWDLADGGKFHGVLMSNQNKANAPQRTLNETGPFLGTNQRCPGGITFGPLEHNPDHRWLYQGGGDNTSFYRLDLEKQIIDTFGPADPKERAPYRNIAWVQAKWLPMNSISRWCGPPSYDEDGNVYLGIGLGGVVIRFTRVK